LFKFGFQVCFVFSRDAISLSSDGKIALHLLLLFVLIFAETQVKPFINSKHQSFHSVRISLYDPNQFKDSVFKVANGMCFAFGFFEGFFKRSSLQENKKTGLSAFFIIFITGMTTFCISNAIS
jgi:hypothetical protein